MVGPKKNLKWADTKQLMTYGIENFEKKQIFEEVNLDPVYVEDGQRAYIGLDIKEI